VLKDEYDGIESLVKFIFLPWADGLDGGINTASLPSSIFEGLGTKGFNFVLLYLWVYELASKIEFTFGLSTVEASLCNFDNSLWLISPLVPINSLVEYSIELPLHPQSI
jgi:hypothetical protein